jgi:hypothetical protein
MTNPRGEMRHRRRRGGRGTLVCGFARERTTNPVKIVAVSTTTPRYPRTVIEMPNFATDSASSATGSGLAEVTTIEHL